MRRSKHKQRWSKTKRKRGSRRSPGTRRLNVRVPARRKPRRRTATARAKISAEARGVAGGLLGVAVLVACALGCRWVAAEALRSRGFRVKEIVIRTPRTIRREHILKVADIRPGTSVFAVDLGKLRKKFLDDPRIEDASVERDPSGGVIYIRVSDRKPVALVRCGEFFGLGADGTLVPGTWRRRPRGLPVVTGILPEELHGEHGARTELARAARVVRAVKLVRLADVDSVREIDIADEKNVMLVMARSGTSVNLGGVPFSQKLRRVRAVLKDLDRRGETAEYVDARFGRDVIVKPRSRGRR